MQREIDITTLKEPLYSEKSIKEFNASLSEGDGRMWLSNESAHIAADAMALALKAIHKLNCEDEDVKSAESFIEVMRKFCLKMIDQELKSRSAWVEEVNGAGDQTRIEGGIYAACSEIDEILYGIINAVERIDAISGKMIPEAAGDAAASILLCKTAMETVKLQRYYYATLISGEVGPRAMRREPELAIENNAERMDRLYTEFQNLIKG